jgi:hypothetical protein
MFNSTILDVAIALAFTYLILALLCTTVNEWFAGILKTRGRMLAKGIAGMFGDQKLPGDKSLLAAFNQHATIGGLRQKSDVYPSYIAPSAFALTVIDLVTQPGAITYDDLENGIKALPDGCAKTALLASIQTAGRDLTKAQAAIENWFNSAMDRVTGWYTRRKQWMSVVGAVIVTIFVNADSLAIANKLWINPTLRQQIVNRARTDQDKLQKLISAEYPDPNKPTDPKVQEPGDKSVLTSQTVLSELGDLIGWETEYTVAHNKDLWATIVDSKNHILGWILTIIAVSLGAPFWFDTLNRFMNIRSSGINPSEAQKGPRKEATA